MLRTIGQKVLGLGLVAALASVGFAQQSQGVVLKSQISLATFGAGAGNDCWGYTSPSGREYAIVGLNNRVTFVEVTDPANPVILQTIPHTSSTWGDIKVYDGIAYAVTEAGGTGVQVINMRDIDSGVVTLVRTIASPGRSHNLVMDDVNGFLYTVGSNQGTGTTMCFDLTDPLNPVKVGPNSMTTNYMHDAQIVTYDSGPMAGKQIWYGFSEGRGVDVYDMTDKNNPIMIKRIVYPNMNYCHQGWLSEDRRFLYVDDELDENNLQVPTRSLIFNVEDPANAYYVGSFTSGLLAIDHNQYVDDGFAFQANYRSGLRIFDVSIDPTAPVQVGWYDTYAPNNNRGFDGAWSTYPFFPSGTVIVSDINGGLFVLDAREALTRKKAASDYTLVRAVPLSGNLASLAEEDGDELSVFQATGIDPDGTVATVEVSSTAFDSSPDRIQFDVVSRGATGGYRQQILMFNWTTNSWDVLSFDIYERVSTRRSVTVTENANRYVQPGTNAVKVRLKWAPDARNIARLRIFVDSVEFRFLR